MQMAIPNCHAPTLMHGDVTGKVPDGIPVLISEAHKVAVLLEIRDTPPMLVLGPFRSAFST